MLGTFLSFQTCNFFARPVYYIERVIVSQYLVGHWDPAKSTNSIMPLMDVKHIVEDERVHWALFLIITGLSVYPDARSSLVGIHATIQIPTV